MGCVGNFDKKANEVWIDNGKNIVKISVEIADDNEETAKGLMYRKKLEENSGMLFIFGNEEYQTFWMKNTVIPLDIIFIDKNSKIVDIKNAVPCKKEPCALYKSSMPAKYVLEVNGNFSINNNIKTGDKLIINGKITKFYK